MGEGSGRLVATFGDLVVGLASPMPPQPFVGELGDPAKQAAASVNQPVVASAGHPPAQPARVSIDNALLATTQDPAMPTYLGPGPAQTPMGSQFVTLQGKPLVRQYDPSQVSPTSAMLILGGRQRVFRVGGPDATEGKDTSTPLDKARESTPTRSEFGGSSGADPLLSRTSPGRRGDLVPPQHAVLVGDPVNVVTGAVVTEATDVATIGVESFRRSYRSDRSDRDGPLGHGWTHSFHQAIWLEPGRVVLRDRDGREIEFDTLELPGQVARAGDELFDATGTLRLQCAGHFQWALHDTGGVRHFAPAAGEDVRNRDRGMSRLVRVARTGARIIELTYDHAARLGEVLVDGRGCASLEYDNDDHLRGIWVRSGEGMQRQASFEYDEDGDLTRSVDARGREREYEYRGHLLVREANPMGGCFYYGYEAQGPAAKCVRTWGSGGFLDRQLEYGGSATTVVDSRGGLFTYGFNALGLVTSIDDPHGDTTKFKYDGALRLIEVTHPDGAKAIDHYDEHGRRIKHRSRDGATWRMRYDRSTGALTERVGPGEARFEFHYDGGGRLARVEDPCGHTTRFEYDDRRLRIVDPLGRTSEVWLTDDGNVESIALPGGQAARFEYDVAGRLAGSYSAEEYRVAWDYDVDGNVTAVIAGDEAVRVERDRAGRVAALEAGAATVQAERDAFGRVVALTSGETRTCYEYDSEGRLEEVARNGEVLLSLSRDARGHVEAYTRAGAEPCAISRHPGSGWIHKIETGEQTIEIEWDAARRIVGVNGPRGAASFGYRDDGRLVSAENPQCSYTFERDARGGVVGQQVGDKTLRSAPLDFRGRRLGVEIEDGAHASFLRDASGDLTRYVVSADDQVFDIRVESGPSGRHAIVSCEEASLEIRRDAWGRTTSAEAHPGDASTWRWPAPEKTLPDLPSAVPLDALQRPVRIEGATLLWDEDRLFARGDDLAVVDPDSGDRVAWVHRGELRFELPDPVQTRTRSVPGDCFPALALHGLIHDVGPTPLRLLDDWFRYRVWDPEVRPVAGDDPWDPDAWHPALEGPAAPAARLGAPELLSIFGGPTPPTLSPAGAQTR